MRKRPSTYRKRDKVREAQITTIERTQLLHRYRCKEAINFMKQAVSLTGLDSTSFANSIQSIDAVEDIFSRQVGESKMVPWKNGTYLDWDTIYASNQYFTSVRNYPNIRPVAFDKLVDPDGTLEALASLSGVSRVHSLDNVVEYYELSEDGK
jgi:hypothetical protein